MIKIIYDLGEITDFIIPFFQDETFSNPMMKTREQFENNLLKTIAHPDDFVFAVYDAGKPIGVFSLLVEDEEKYLEMLSIFSKEKKAYDECFAFLFHKYKGYQLDFVINPKNHLIVEKLKKYNAVFETEQIKMLLSTPTQYKTEHKIIPYEECYYSAYTDMHTSEGYWTAEKVLIARNRFKVFLAIDADQVIGYIDVTYVYEENEPYDLYVKKEYRNKGYGKALLQKAILENHPKKMALNVNIDNLSAISVYSKLGFEPCPGSNSITAHIFL